MNKHPIGIAPVEVDGRTVWIGRVPLDSLAKGIKKRDVDRFVKRYHELVVSCQRTLNRIKCDREKSGTANPVLYWEIGDHLHSFLAQAEQSPFFINGLHQHLKRDTALGGKLFQRCLRFRRKFEEKKDISPERTWSSYR